MADLALRRRNLRPLLRTPQLLVADAPLRPVLLTLLFTYVLGGPVARIGSGWPGHTCRTRRHRLDRAFDSRTRRVAVKLTG
ncbi:MAG TPA: hypothetical protein VFA46_20095 [Actinomycetes bacterium]|nr:hypothetical protein [Actinomycetes bacterium]